MSIYVSSGGNSDEYKQVSTGTHPAVCTMLVDLGLQSSTFNGETRWKHKLYFRWEVPGERAADGKPLSVGMQITASLHKKGNLRGLLESWRGKAFTEDELQKFDVSAVLGKPCLLNVLQEQKGDKIYANVKGVMALPKSIPAPKAESTPVLYSGDPSVLAHLPDWLKEKIATQKKPDAKPAVAAPASADVDLDIPF